MGGGSFELLGAAPSQHKKGFLKTLVRYPGKKGKSLFVKNKKNQPKADEEEMKFEDEP